MQLRTVLYLAEDFRATFVFVISRVISSMPLLKMSTLAYRNKRNMNSKPFRAFMKFDIRMTLGRVGETRGDGQGLYMTDFTCCAFSFDPPISMICLCKLKQRITTHETV